MNGGLFTVIFASPVERFEREVRSLRVVDLSGHLGILKNHADFTTVLAPSLGIYRTAEDKEVFLAINGGVLTVSRGKVTVLSRELIESEDAGRLTGLSSEKLARRDSVEAEFREMLTGIITAFWRKNIEHEKTGKSE